MRAVRVCLCTYKPKGGIQTAEEDEACVCKILVDEESEEGDSFESRTVAEGTNEASTALEERGREGGKGEEREKEQRKGKGEEDMKEGEEGEERKER